MIKCNTVQFPSFSATQNNKEKTEQAEKLLNQYYCVYGEYKYAVMWAIIQYAKCAHFTDGKDDLAHYEAINTIFKLLESNMSDFEFLSSVATLIEIEKQRFAHRSPFENIVYPVIQNQINRLNIDTASAYMAISCLSSIFSVTAGFSKQGETMSKNLWFVAKSTATVSAGVYLFGSLLRRYKPELYAPLIRVGQTIDSPKVWRVTERLVGGTFRLILNQAERLANLLPEARPLPKVENQEHVGVVTI